MADERYLSKSRFKLALECPTKLFYTNKKEEYANQDSDNEFLKALAEGGFQVGELAKIYYPGGKDLKDELDYDKSLNLTNEELKKRDCVIYEAAFRYKNLFIRADVVVKKGNTIFLYEVKSKSYDPNTDALIQVNDKKGTTKINGDFEAYLQDVCFQKYVIKNATGLTVRSFLTLANKRATASIAGLNQKFRIVRNGKRAKGMPVGTFTETDLGTRILIDVPTDDIYDMMFHPDYKVKGHEGTFEELIWKYSDLYEKDEILFTPIDSKCGSCEFYTKPEQKQLKSGLRNCLLQKLDKKDLEKPLTFELWGGGWTKLRGIIIRDGHLLLHDIPATYFEVKEKKGKAAEKEKEEKKSGMHHLERKQEQIRISKEKDMVPHVRLKELKKEMGEWEFPLHMIDFETTRVAIPFYNGQGPYEQVAFQFSHHTIQKNGTVKHEGEWLNLNQGEFPNFQFIRKLKEQLENDEGTVFRYAYHENGVLNDIHDQLAASDEKDKLKLMKFIRTLTFWYEGDDIKEGDRCMIDLLEMVKRFYIQYDMKGSNSLKYVLPAIIRSSKHLQKTYSGLAYGTTIKSKNFPGGKKWIEKDTKGVYKDPYQLLDTFYSDLTPEELDKIFGNKEDESIRAGGAAMMAYAELQFADTTTERREEIRKALLKYCELDTLAMVMIWEHWMELIKK